VHDLLLELDLEGKRCILACSARKESYRQLLSSGIHNLHFVLLEAPPEVLEQRLRARTAHFMNPDLLASQIATLEVPSKALHVSVTGEAKDTVDFILQQLKA
jgi:carbohydrate kinase (thermoresistant glucokinase family)